MYKRQIQIIYVLLVSVFLVIYLILGSPRKIIWLPLSCTPPWHLVTPTVDLSLSTHSKSVNSPEIYHSKFLEICQGLQDYYDIYTDGSKMNNLTAAAAVGRDVSKSLRINSHASIFTAELVALNLSLDIIPLYRLL